MVLLNMPPLEAAVALDRSGATALALLAGLAVQPCQIVLMVRQQTTLAVAVVVFIPMGAEPLVVLAVVQVQGQAALLAWPVVTLQSLTVDRVAAAAGISQAEETAQAESLSYEQ